MIIKRKYFFPSWFPFIWDLPKIVFLFDDTETYRHVYWAKSFAIHLDSFSSDNVLLQIHLPLCPPEDPKPLFDAGQLQTSACTALQLPGGGGTH